MLFSIKQVQNAALEVIACNEGWDGEPLDPHYFLGLVTKHLEEFGAADYERTGEEIEALHKANRKAAPAAPVGPAPKKNDVVRVIRGKSLPWGTEGRVFWTGLKVYNGKNVLRIGMKDMKGQTLWTSANNVEVCSKG